MMNRLNLSSDRIAYNELTKRQKRRRINRWEDLGKCIEIVAGTTDPDQQWKMFLDRMQATHRFFRFHT